MKKQGVGGKYFGQMRQVDLVFEAAQHLLGPFSKPFFGVKFLYDYGLCRGNNRGISPEKVL
jgi:hypothetical protein